MVRLEKVNGKNVWDLLKLDVLENQKNFVAGNDCSIIEAYTAITGNGYAFPFGIYDGETPVGFLMIGFGIVDRAICIMEIHEKKVVTYDSFFISYIC